MSNTLHLFYVFSCIHLLLIKLLNNLVLGINSSRAGYFCVQGSSQFFIHLLSLQNLSLQHVLTSRMKSSVDPDQLASVKPADLDLH